MGYEFIHMDRQNKGGGGVAFFVDCTLKFNVVENMSVALDNLFECITIEIDNGNNKNIIIMSCIYRTPRSSIDLFSDQMEELLARRTHKTIFICGHFNIDLLNSSNHKMTENFNSTMHSMSLYPRITRPTRITAHSTTLIDNIFTNDISNSTKSGILISDISDHLPVFTVTEENLSQINVEKKYLNIED